MMPGGRTQVLGHYLDSICHPLSPVHPRRLVRPASSLLCRLILIVRWSTWPPAGSVSVLRSRPVRSRSPRPADAPSLESSARSR